MASSIWLISLPQTLNMHLAKYFIIICFYAPIIAIAQDWEEQYNKDGIVVYTMSEPATNTHSFKALTTIEKSAETVYAAITDYDHVAEWQAVDELIVLKVLSDTFKIVGSYIPFPWPLSDRYSVSEFNTSVDRTNKEVNYTIKVISSKSYPPKREGVELLEKGYGYWILKENEKGHTEIEYFYAADAGNLPSWVVNLFIVDAPKDALLALRKEVLKAPYQNPNLPFWWD